MWALMTLHLHAAGSTLTNWVLAAVIALSLTISEAVPGEDYLIRIGAAAFALAAISALFVRAWRLLTSLKQNAEDWADIKHDVPQLKKEIAANTEATLANGRIVAEIKATLDQMTDREGDRDIRETKRDIRETVRDTNQ